jgi:dTDP-4-amino-4,6-dideoxygalactose transaminase
VNAFVLRGARIVFADSNAGNPNMDVNTLEALITPKTKAIVAMHYAGIACDMDSIMAIAARHNVFVVEDAAQSIDSYYKGRPLGSIGHLAAFSFHETKNVISGEGGLLAINHEQFLQRAEVISEKGTNRQAFVRGDVKQYEWVDIGSSFMPSELTAAFLYAQLQELRPIQEKRLLLWNTYFSGLQEAEGKGYLKRPQIPPEAAHNGHIFYIVLADPEQRQPLIRFLKDKGISSAFHFLSLNKSRFYEKNNLVDLAWSDRYTDCLLRLPLYHELSTIEVGSICEHVEAFFKKK